MTRAFAVLLACVLVLAGCSGFSGGSGTDGSAIGAGTSDSGAGESGDDPEGSVTPAPVPTVETLPPPAPGVDADGVTNASRLGAAHDARFEDESFTKRVAWTFRYPNGTFYQGHWRTTRVGENGTRYRDVVHRSGAWLGEFRSQGYVTTGVERWWAGEGRGLRANVLFDGTRRYSAIPSEETAVVGERLADPGGDRIARLLAGAETRVTGRVVRNGTSYHRLGALGIRPNAVPVDSDLAPPEDVSLSLLVGSRGLVRSYTVTYTTRTPAGAPLTTAYVVQYGGVGETTVDRPAWYAEALRTTNETKRTDGPNGTSGTDGANGTTDADASRGSGLGTGSAAETPYRLTEPGRFDRPTDADESEGPNANAALAPVPSDRSRARARGTDR